MFFITLYVHTKNKNFTVSLYLLVLRFIHEIFFSEVY